MNWTVKVILVASTCLWTGCTVGPNYVKPEMAPPDAWHQPIVEGLADGPANLQAWWELLDDSILTELIARARQQNRGVQSALARIDQARAVYSFNRGTNYPDLNAFGSYSRGGIVRNPPFALDDDINTLGLDSTWEIDVFGRIRRSVEVAEASLQASIEDYRDTLVVLYAEVALTYVDIRTLQARLEFARKNVVIQQESLELSQNRLAAELVPELDVEQAKLNLATTESLIPQLEMLYARAVHRLGVLLGAYPGELYSVLHDARPIPAVPEEVSAGLAVDLVRQRPDIRRAERDLAAQTAQVGVATSDLYPRFSLSGSFAYVGTQFEDLGDMDFRSWSIGPAIRWNLFDGNRIRSRIRIEQAVAEQAMLAYEQTLLIAVEEVENALVGVVQERLRQRSLMRSVDAARKSAEQVRVLYRSGLTDFQNVLETERRLFEQQDALAASEGAVVQHVISLYKALGGGWSVNTEIQIVSTEF